MRAYFETYKATGDASNINFYAAYEGFTAMGFHIILIERPEQIPADDKECVAVGSINFLHAALRHLGKKYPADLNYPDCLMKYTGRKIWTSTINQIDGDDSMWNVFIKPKGRIKTFVGRVVRSVADFRGIGDPFSNTPVWVSEVVNFKREWRAFVRYGQVLDVRPYKGDWKVSYDASVIENAVADFTGAPTSYAMDFGVTDDGRTLLVEVNDGYSIGSYGLFFLDYCKLLSARWAELTEQKDLCAFDR